MRRESAGRLVAGSPGSDAATPAVGEEEHE